MTDRLATLKESDALQLQSPPLTAITPEQLALIKRTVAAGATDEELQLFIYDCKRQGVHPLDKLVHFSVRTQRSTGKRTYTPITSIDLMRIRAADTGECGGIDDAIFEDGNDYPDSASVTVYRFTQGNRCPFKATARWSEYYPGDGNEGFMWRKMPRTMLGKCAEALALRKAFPKQLHGLYERAEMAQAGREDEARVVNAPYADPSRAPRSIDVTHLPEAKPAKLEPSAETLFPTPDETEERNALILRGTKAIKDRKLTQPAVRRVKAMFLGSEDVSVEQADLAALSALVDHLEAAEMKP